jgi:RecA/RadA recombinase
MTAETRVLDYFSRILKRGGLEEVRFKDDPFIGVPRDQVLSGALTQEQADELLGEKKPSQPVNVVLSLLSLNDGSQSSAKADSLAGLLLLEAQLSSDGRLQAVVTTGSSPWIPAERLESPSVTGRQVMVGSLSDYWQASRSVIASEISRVESVRDAVVVAERMFREISGLTPEEFAARWEEWGETVHAETVYIQKLDRIKAFGGLLDLFDFLGRQSDCPPLVSQLITGHRGPRTSESEIHDGAGLADPSLACSGSMGDENSLTESQRRVVHGFMRGILEGTREITAVSGPPGTGKTTMLQSIVANLLTSHALAGERAPVIIGMSTNNQAVTNIIRSFASVTKSEPGTLDVRWLPAEKDGGADAVALKSLAVYCPSNAKIEAAKKDFLVEKPDRSQTYAAYSSAAYLEAARDRFLAAAHEHFGVAATPAALKTRIHDELTDVDRLREKLIRTMQTQGPGADYLRLCAVAEESPHLRDNAQVGDLKKCSTLEDLDKKLDVTLRYAAFWLAVHYYEAEWLLIDADDFIPEEDRWKNTREIVETYWRQAAALTPCFVMTAYQVPRYARLYAKKGEPAKFAPGLFDLLIVDEAGQVDTPIGLPAFALAQRAVVVGDEQQLAPVWSLDEETDREVAEDAGITPGDWTEGYRARGVTASKPSSLMRAASHASRWQFGEKGHPGLLLTEHFRCHPDIIGYCNELLYEGMLKPMRPPKASLLHELTPAFLFTEVDGSQDIQLGSSRQNRVEAKVIAEWIIRNYAAFFRIYNTDVTDPNKRVEESEVIGVVTPFSAQARCVEEELRKAVASADLPEGTPGDLHRNITVGTAHRLQGAERPVILFSAAYGENSPQSGFIDASPELMNVAVSRAKDLFIVFAAKNRWNNGAIFTTMSRFAAKSDAVFSDDPAPLPEAEPSVSAPPAPEETVSTAIERPPVAELPAVEVLAGVLGKPVTATVLLKAWRESGILREEDSTLKASDLNLRLRDVGVLVGKPKQWEASTLAANLGLMTETRTQEDGTSYSLLLFAPELQEILVRLYRNGRLRKERPSDASS